jgi:hypothetical protein
MDYHPLLQSAYDAWLKQEDFSYILKGEELAGLLPGCNQSEFSVADICNF